MSSPPLNNMNTLKTQDCYSVESLNQLKPRFTFRITSKSHCASSAIVLDFNKECENAFNASILCLALFVGSVSFGMVMNVLSK